MSKCNHLIKYSKTILSIIAIDQDIKMMKCSLLFSTRVYRFMLIIRFMILIFLNIIALISYKHPTGTDLIDIDAHGLTNGQALAIIQCLGATMLMITMYVLSRHVLKLVLFYKNIYNLGMRGNNKGANYLPYENEELSRFMLHYKDYPFYDDLIVIILTLFAMIMSPLIYCFLLIYIIYKYEINFGFWKAVKSSFDKLVVLAVMIYAAIFLFAIIGFYFYSTEYPFNSCYSLWTCLVITADQFFKTGNGIAGFLYPAYTANSDGVSVNINYTRVIFDNVSNLLVIIFLLQIVTGIVVDTFSQIRNQKTTVRNDELNNCFICGKNRKELEKEQGYSNFDDHIFKKHHKWNYIFFIDYLSRKNKKEKELLTDIEEYVINMIESNNQKWFPCYKLD